MNMQDGHKQNNISNLELLARLRAGDEAARKELIEKNTLLVGFLVHKFRDACTLDPRPRVEDLDAIGLLALVEAAHAIPLSHPHPSGYLATWVRGALKRGVWQEHFRGVVPGHRAVRMAAYEGHDDPGVYTLPSEPDAEIDHVDNRIDFQDTVDAACRDTVDRKIIEMLVSKYTTREIAAVVKRSQSTVCRRVKRLKKKIRGSKRGLDVK
jgi:RNA polymerase sigma factor (sigma-70 family)